MSSKNNGNDNSIAMSCGKGSYAEASGNSIAIAGCTINDPSVLDALLKKLNKKKEKKKKR